MKHSKNFILFLLRISLGSLFFYAGISKILNPDWSAAGYLNSAKTFAPMYHWFASTANIGWINIVNEWGLTLVGIALFLGIGTYIVAGAGALLMLLYYFPILDFPYAGEHSYIVDEHIIYFLSLLLLMAANAGRFWGLDSIRKRNRAV